MTLVVGAGGLLGSAVRRALGSADALDVPWGTPAAADVLRAAGSRDVVWCAGAGVTATGPEALAEEVRAFEALLDGMPGGRLFVASSAGGVYAGSAPAPFDETSRVAPLSAYGEAKLALEAAATAWAARTGGAVVLGRIANLYGPGQDVTKPQGLVSQLCRAHLLRAPVSVYVSLDTLRDYLYVDDAARLVTGCLDRAVPGVTVKVLASQHALTVGAVLAELRRVSRRSPRVVLAASPQAAVQARDLRLRSTVWSDLDAVPVTPFPVGLRRTLDDLAGRLRAGSLV